jgi:hypothetical protein
MKALLITLLLHLNLWAQGANQVDVPGVKNAPSPKKNKGISTHIYEKENAAKTFSATVKIIREFQGEWEVMFNGQTGFYTVKEESQALLVEAEKKKANVIIKVDEESKQVISAGWGAPSSSGEASPASGGTGPGR